MNDNGTSDGEANASLAVEAHVGQRNEHLAVIEIGTLSVILVLAVVSNLFMMVAIWRQRRNRPLSRMYFFMLHLSMADLMVAIFHILPQLAWDITYSFQGGDFLCRFVKYAQVMTLYLSTYILMFMAIDRYRAVCCKTNLHWNSLKVARGMVCASWAMALVFALPQVFIFKEMENDYGVVDCWGRFIEPWGAKAYVTWFVTSIFGAPLLVMAVCYGVICRQLWIYSLSASDPIVNPPPPVLSRVDPSVLGKWTSARRWMLRLMLRCQNRSRPATPTASSATAASSGSSGSLPMRTISGRPASLVQPQCCVHRPIPLRRSNSNRITKAKMKTIKMTLVVVACFVACLAPFCVTQLIMVYNPPSNAADTNPVLVIFLLLASLNSCTNPWVYLAFSGSLLNQMRVCVGLRWRRGNDNDSIGEDAPERRQRTLLEAGAVPFVAAAGSARHHHHHQQRGFSTPPAVPYLRCNKDDVVVRLKQTNNKISSDSNSQV